MLMEKSRHQMNVRKEFKLLTSVSCSDGEEGLQPVPKKTECLEAEILAGGSYSFLDQRSLCAQAAAPRDSQCSRGSLPNTSPPPFSLPLLLSRRGASGLNHGCRPRWERPGDRSRASGEPQGPAEPLPGPQQPPEHLRDSSSAPTWLKTNSELTVLGGSLALFPGGEEND
ncbi:uncharacterized protein LOC125080017 [Lutra lutra]|uniref:uncharacterized protein LOC125080017 n=1 Tax=Lutra lutra TaxID=9657 RepID=UPI001FD5FEA7|nr:uncharacterized protein LOC125080017 [Lutra lutra]